MVHGNTAYFSRDYSVYSYTLAKDEWSELQSCEHFHFGLAVVKSKVTTIGGHRDGTAISTLASWHEGLFGWGAEWKEVLPPMPKPRALPATVTTSTHLIVAGGEREQCGGPVSSIEVHPPVVLCQKTCSSAVSTYDTMR